MCSAPWYSKTRRRSFRRESSEHVAEEDRRAQHALDQPEQQRGVELVLDQAREADGDQEEQDDGERQREHHGAGPDGLRDLLRLIALLGALLGRQLGVGGDLERTEADRHRAAERDDAADDRQPQQAVPRASPESSGKVFTSISPSAASSGERSPSASCSSVGLRTATAQLETPRIITPSSTA